VKVAISPPIRVALMVATLLAGGVTDLAGQAGVIRGRVTRADGPIGLADVELVLSPFDATSRTDAHGYFEFSGVTPGRVELAARRPGFVPTSVTLSVVSHAATEVEIALEPLAAILDPIVTMVTRDSRSLADVAAAVSVVDSSVILRDRTIGLHEALRTMPGVQVASRYGTHDVNIGIRGSAARTFQAVRGVAVLLDGVPLTQPEGRTRVDIIEPAAARQIEVVRGPASTLHSASTGGVVNVVSRTGRDSRGTTVRVQGGGFGFRKVDARAGGVFAGGRGSGLAAGSYTTTDGYRGHSDADVARGQAVLDYLAGPTLVSFQATGSRLDSRLPGSLSLPQFDADPDAAAPAAEAFGFGRIDRSYRAGARVETAAGSAVASGYFFYGRGALFLPIPSEIVDADLRRVQGGVYLRSSRIAHLPLDVTVGFDYDRLFGPDHRWENDAGAAGALLDEGRYSVPALGAYGQAEWQAAAAVTATLGLRYDHVTYGVEGEMPGSVPRQETTVHQASPRLAVRWRPDAVTSVYASVGRGFEVPTLAELVPRPSAPIRSVRPKSLWNYEVGGRRTVGNRVVLDGAAFLAAVRGEFVPVTIEGLDLPENASRSRNLGVELGITALATPWLDLGASYTFLDVRLQDYTTSVLDSTGARADVDFAGKRLPAVPRQRVTGEVQVRPTNRLNLGVQVEWQDLVHVETSNAARGTWYFQLEPGGPVQDVPFRAVPARALVHLNAAHRLGTATLFGRVENLFGARYAANLRANEIFGRFYEAGSPAWVSVGLSLAGWGPAPDASP
jgi:iron complex outermembrane receptor protein